MTADSRPKLCYLAGPIDLVDRDSAQGWRTKAAQQLANHGIGVFSPAHAFELPLERTTRSMARAVLEINHAAMGACGAILANLSGPGYGTPIELDFMSRQAGKPSACFNGKLESLYVQTWPHYDSMHEAITALVAEFV